MIKIRRATLQDLDAIYAIQGKCYSGEELEQKETFEKILETSHNYCFVALNCKDNIVIGFLMAHNWNDCDPPKLNMMYTHAHTHSYIYIHDLTLSHVYRNQGIGKQLVKALLDHVQYTTVTLVSVRSSIYFWIKCGFQYKSCSQQVLDSYNDASAVFMTHTYTP